MLWIVLAVVAVLFLIGVAIHFAFREQVQKECLDSLERLKDHHESLMRQATARHSQKRDELELHFRAALDKSDERIAELENKLKTVEAEKFNDRKTFREELKKLNNECDMLRQHNTTLHQEVDSLNKVIGKVQEAIGNA